MKSKKLFLSVPLTILAALAVAGVAEAHNATATPSCTGLAHWAINFDKTVVNTIVVKVDGAIVYQDLDFKSSDEGTHPWSQTAPHTWSVVINAPGTQYDRSFSGTWQPCQTPPTTTVAPTTTTTVPIATTTAPPVTSVEPNVTTTSVVAVDIPPVPTLALIPPVIIAADASVEPALPVTGGGDEVAFIAIAAGLIAVGVYLVIRGRRVP